jgi:putative solute:sodium symporter small subunit
METEPSPSARPAALKRYWRYNLRLSLTLLAAWALLVLLAAIFARPLNDFTLLGIPLAFYIFAQGAPLCFLLIIGIYARQMNRADDLFAKNNAVDTEKSPSLSNL